MLRPAGTRAGPTVRGRWLPTVASLRERFYPDRVNRDPVAAFIRQVEARVRPGHQVLDLGAGAGELNGYAFKGRVRQMIGIDLDSRVAENPLLDAGLRADVYALPFRDHSFDVIFSVYVLEHIDRPERLTAEIARVLRPGGVCLILTPNRYHYVSVVSRLTPTAFHRWVNERRGRAANDTFPTHYKLNSKASLTRHFAGAGLDIVRINTIEVQPNYLTFSPVAYACGVAYERLVNSTDSLSSIRVNLIGLFMKPLHSVLEGQDAGTPGARC